MADKSELRRLLTAEELRQKYGGKPLSVEERLENLRSNLDVTCDTRDAWLQSLGFEPVSEKQSAANLHDILTGQGIY